MSADLIRAVYHICFRPRSRQIEKRGITEFLLNYGAATVSRFENSCCSFHLMTIESMPLTKRESQVSMLFFKNFNCQVTSFNCMVKHIRQGVG